MVKNKIVDNLKLNSRTKEQEMIDDFLTHCKMKKLLFPNVYIGKITVAILLATILIFFSVIILLNYDALQSGSYRKIHQPTNVFSSIVYLLVAIIILSENLKKTEFKSDIKNKENLIHKIAFALVLTYIFVASSFYHSLQTKMTLKIDYSAVYFFSLFPVMYFSYQWLLARNHFSKQNSCVLVYTIYLCICLTLSIYVPLGKEELVTFACIVLFFAVVAYFFKQRRTNFEYVFLSVGCIIIGLFWFELDKFLIIHYSNCYIRTHSLWNLFIGCSGFYFYIFIRDQDYEDKKKEINSGTIKNKI